MPHPFNQREGGRWSLDLVGDVEEGFVDAHLLELVREAANDPHHLRRETLVVVEVWPQVDCSRTEGPGPGYRHPRPDTVASRHIVAGDYDATPFPFSGVCTDDYRFVR